MYDAPEDKPGSPATTSPRAAGTAMRVLLAEDSAVSGDMTQAMATHVGVDMDVARNGLEAIEMIQAAQDEGRPYTLLLADVMMPVIDGIEMTRQVRASGITEAQMPIVAVTAATEVEDIRSYRAAGMQAFLQKPVSMQDLRAVFAAWGHRSRRRKETIRARAMLVLGAQFAARKAETLETIETAIAMQSRDEAVVSEIRTMLHQIAGTAGSFGDAALGEAAKACEMALLAAAFDDTDVLDVLVEARDVLRGDDLRGEGA